MCRTRRPIRKPACKGCRSLRYCQAFYAARERSVDSTGSSVTINDLAVNEPNAISQFLPEECCPERYMNRFDALRIFCIAAESLNFRDAATRLGISPQVITRVVKKLEE